MSQDQPPNSQPSSPTPSQPAPSPPATPVTKASTLQQAKQIGQTVQRAVVKASAATVELGKRARAFWTVTQPKVQRWWSATLPKIRGVLPQTWNDKLADWMITSGAIALVVVLFWVTTSILFPNRPVAAKTPPASVGAPKNAPQNGSKPAPKNTSKPAPADPAKLTAIQNQLAEVAAPYAPELPTVPGMENPEMAPPKLVDWVRLNPSRERLTVQLGDAWYELDAAQQDALANDLFRRSLKLKFEQLEIADAAGKQLARSPVVGSKMVVLQRQM